MTQGGFSTLDEALKWLYSATNYEQKAQIRYNTRTFNLERTQRMLQMLGYPHTAYPTVHIAGTKGKGSTSAMTAAILHEAGGWKVGLYTSPHLMKMEERIAVDFAPIGDEALRACLSRVRSAVEAVTAIGPEWKPTFFELFTVAAFAHFAASKVDTAVIEVGLGGRLDATNAVRPVVTGITPISYDHTGVLGETLTAIATEKAGIIKEGVPVVTGVQEAEALSVIEETARKRGARVVRFGREYRLAEGAGGEFAVVTPEGRYEGLRLTLLGPRQRENAAMAVTLAEIASAKMGVILSEEAVRRALGGLVWPGRAEIWSEKPPIVIDAAHNAASARALVAALKEKFGDEKCVLVFAIAQHKDSQGVIEALADVASEFVVTTIDSPRSSTAEELAEAVSAKVDVPVSAVADRKEALALGRQLAGDGILVITGSFYLAGELREVLLRERDGAGDTA